MQSPACVPKDAAEITSRRLSGRAGSARVPARGGQKAGRRAEHREALPGGPKAGERPRWRRRSAVFVADDEQSRSLTSHETAVRCACGTRGERPFRDWTRLHPCCHRIPERGEVEVRTIG